MDFLEFKTTEQIHLVYNHAHVYNLGEPYVDADLMSRPYYDLFGDNGWCARMHSILPIHLRALNNLFHFTVFPRYAETSHNENWFPDYPSWIWEEECAIYYFVYPVIEVSIKEPLWVPSLPGASMSSYAPVGPNTLQIQVKNLDRQFMSIVDKETGYVAGGFYNLEIHGNQKRKLRKPYDIVSSNRSDVIIPVSGIRKNAYPLDKLTSYRNIYVKEPFNTFSVNGFSTYYEFDFVGYRRSLPYWSDNNQLDLINKVYERIKGTSFNIPTTVGAEGRETILYLMNRLKSFQKLMLGVKTRDALMISEALGLVDKKTNRRWHRAGGSIITDPQAKRQFVSARGIADLWMEWRYAIRPLIHDLDEAIKALKELNFQQPDRKVAVRLRVKHSGVCVVYNRLLYIVEDENEFRSRLGTDIIYSSPIYFTMKWELFIKRGCSVKVKANTVDWVATLGMLSWKQALWEAVPYSFVVDWFLPIGRWLQASENIQTVHIAPPETSYTKEQWYFTEIKANLVESYLLSPENTARLNLYDWKPDSFKVGNLIGGTHCSGKVSRFKRSLGDPEFLRLPPSPDGITIEGAFKWQRAADLSVLASNIIETLKKRR